MDKTNLVVGFDADDTLWHNEDLFADIQNRLSNLVGRYVEISNLDETLVEIERENLDLFGYGIKSFTLSMVETAIKITDSKINAEDIRQILEWGKEMLAHPVNLLDDVAEVIGELARTYRLALITKGELFQQETKIASSGLADHFEFIEIVSHKTPETYQQILEKHGVEASSFIMVGNSFRSDILPIINLGGTAIFIPYHITWELEQVSEATKNNNNHIELKNISDLPEILEKLTS